MSYNNQYNTQGAYPINGAPPQYSARQTHVTVQHSQQPMNPHMRHGPMSPPPMIPPPMHHQQMHHQPIQHHHHHHNNLHLNQRSHTHNNRRTGVVPTVVGGTSGAVVGSKVGGPVGTVVGGLLGVMAAKKIVRNKNRRRCLRNCRTGCCRC